MIEIDGSSGEGGGQMVRTALALSAITGKAFRITDIRAGRPVPGLKAQHLHCVAGIQKLCSAKVDGATLGSSTLEVIPGALGNGNVNLDIGTAGSIPLVLQALTLPAIFARGKVRFRITGGTDVPWAPPIDHLTHVLIPHLRKYADIDLSLAQRGYYPAGGGVVEMTIKPKFELSYGDELLALLPKFSLIQQGTLLNIKGISHASQDLASTQVAERQASTARQQLSSLGVPIQVQTAYAQTHSPGSGITLWAQFGTTAGMDFANPIILGSAVLGRKGMRAEEVGMQAAVDLRTAIASSGGIDAHLADQLIPYLGVFGGTLRAAAITPHTRTNIAVVEAFLGTRIAVDGAVISVL